MRALRSGLLPIPNSFDFAAAKQTAAEQTVKKEKSDRRKKNNIYNIFGLNIF